METHKVTLAEYNQSLRDAVNAYYEHARNELNMSVEEASLSTYEMSERYLIAVEEFQADVQAKETVEQAASVETVEAPTVAETAGNEAGLQGGMEGGIGGE